MRIAIGSFMQETNSFSPTQTTVDTFASYYLLRGDEMLTGYGAARVEVPAFLAVLRDAGATPAPLLAAWAGSSGPLTRDTFDVLLGEMIDRLRAGLPYDGVLLALHGAMVTVDDDDAESTILAAVRSVVGPDVPIAVSLDLHAHVTQRMVDLATCLVGYHEYPHIDMYQTGQRAATLLLDTIQGRKHPVMALAKRPMVVSAVSARTTEGPLKEVADAARAMESSGRILDAAIFPVQPWLDVPDLGFAALVIADGDVPGARAAAEELAGMAWERRARFEPDLVELGVAIRTALEQQEGLTVVADPGDAPTSGAPADSTIVLRALLDAKADRAGRLSYVTLCDAAAARQAAMAGVGHDVTLRAGHVVSTGAPIEVTGRVRTLSDGVYRMTGAGANGLEMRMGLTAVLGLGDIRLAIRSLPGMEWDPALYAAVGLDPREACLVFVKSPGHFRVSYGPLARRVLVADTPGPACANMRRVPFTRVTRPLYPLDDM